MPNDSTDIKLVGKICGLAPNRWQAVSWLNDDSACWHIYALPGLTMFNFHGKSWPVIIPIFSFIISEKVRSSHYIGLETQAWNEYREILKLCYHMEKNLLLPTQQT